jgi:hypothetical protein
MTDLIGVVIAVALAFMTGGLSLLVMAPLLVSQAPVVAPIAAKWIAARVGHTENPFTPLHSGEKSAQDASAIVTVMANALAKEGLDPTTAHILVGAIAAKVQAASAAGRFPGSDDFLTAADKQEVRSVIDPTIAGRITMKASDLV